MATARSRTTAAGTQFLDPAVLGRISNLELLARTVVDGFLTGLHRSPVGYKWKEIYQRGDEFYDWDGHAFHFIGGIPKYADGSLALYTPKEQDAYLRELVESLKKGMQP